MSDDYGDTDMSDGYVNPDKACVPRAGWSFTGLTVQAWKTHPARIFWFCAGFHLLAWTIVPALANPNPPIDVIEGYAWGREWLLGTYKHPPMQAWILEILAFLTGRAPWAHFLASQLAVVGAVWAVWRTGRRIVGETGGLVGALLLLCIPYYNFLTPEFNPNILQLPFWAFIAASFYSAVKDNRTSDWLAFGAWCAGGLYVKYSTGLLIVVLGLLMIAHPQARRRLASKGPWLAVLTGALLFAPHAAWLFRNDFMPFFYAQDRFAKIPYAAAFLIGPLSFILSQAVTLLPAVLAWGAGFRFRKAQDTPAADSFDRYFLSFVAFGPAILTVLIAAASGCFIRDMWGTPFWNFIGVWAVFYFRPLFQENEMRRFARAGAAVVLVALIGFFCADFGGPYVTHQVKRIGFPGHAFADEISDTWQRRYHSSLYYVAGDTWPAGNIAYHASDRPHLLIDGNYKISPWLQPEDVRKYGGVIVWCTNHCTTETPLKLPDWVRTEFPTAEIQPPLTFAQMTGARVPAAAMGWAIVPPLDAPGSPAPKQAP